VRTTLTFGKLELLGLIEDYRQGLVPLIVPLTLLKHRLFQHVNRHPMPEWVPVPFRVHQQVYPNPCAEKLPLRNRMWLYKSKSSTSDF
jgi:uncharacterized protein YbgA (DUF1722 family)